MQRAATIISLSGSCFRRPGRGRLGGPRLAAWLGVVGLQVVPLFVPARVFAQDAYPPHEAPPTDGWIKHPWAPEGEQVAAGLDGHVGYVERDGYVSVQVNVDLLGRNIVGDAANEPSIAVDPTKPRKMAIGWRQFDSVESDFRQAGVGYSHDGGVTWTFPGSLTPGVFGSDPVLDSDAYGNFYYVSISLDETRLFKSFDGGVTWGAPIQTFRASDKPWLLVTQRPGDDHPIVLFTQSTPLEMHVSFDGGMSFAEPIRSGGAVWGTIAMDSRGFLHSVYGEPLLVSTSEQPLVEGTEPSFVLQPLPIHGMLAVAGDPNPGGLLGQMWIATHHHPGEASDHAFVLGSIATPPPYPVASCDVLFFRSVDGGETWEDPVQVNDDGVDNGQWHWFGMMSVAPNGRIDTVWNDTRNHPDAPDSRLSELYYAYSTDDGTTWSENVPVSPVFDSRIGWPAGNPKLGDYYHMRSDNLGVNVAYAATFNGEQDIWFLRIGPHDCNANEVPDETDIRRNTSRDRNGNGIPDECELFGDFNGDSRLDLRDYQGVQLCFGAPSADLPGPRCARLDLDLDNNVDLVDLRLLSNLLEL